jgi:thioredoxin-related protein
MILSQSVMPPFKVWSTSTFDVQPAIAGRQERTEIRARITPMSCGPVLAGCLTSGACRPGSHPETIIDQAMKTSLTTFAALALLAVSANARTWKEAASARTLEGDYVRTEAGQVTIVRRNGTSVKIPLDRLSDEDKKFITEQDAAKAATAIAKDDTFKWETDFEVAKQRAKDENKDMLLDFTGSDWCGWCIRLNKEVFSKPSFKEYAAKKLVMVELDFPHKSKLSAKETEQNAKLAKEFKVGGYPTVILLNSRGKEVGRTGYQEGGPEKYIEHLKEMLK